MVKSGKLLQKRKEKKRKVCLGLLLLDGWWRHWALTVGRPDCNQGSRCVALGGTHLRQVSFGGGGWDLDSAPFPLGFICHGCCLHLGTVHTASVRNSGFCRRESKQGGHGCVGVKNTGEKNRTAAEECWHTQVKPRSELAFEEVWGCVSWASGGLRRQT